MIKNIKRSILRKSKKTKNKWKRKLIFLEEKSSDIIITTLGKILIKMLYDYSYINLIKFQITTFIISNNLEYTW